jgi:hypothetical protein
MSAHRHHQLHGMTCRFFIQHVSSDTAALDGTTSLSPQLLVATVLRIRHHTLMYQILAVMQ